MTDIGIPTRCPICGNAVIRPNGYLDANVVLIGEFPGIVEVRGGVAFIGETGKILSAEIARSGIGRMRCMSTNLWAHTDNKNPECLKFSKEYLLLLLHDPRRRAALLMGSNVVKELTGQMVMKVCGLPVTVPSFPKNIELVMAATNPASLAKEGETVGEFRLALSKFVRELTSRGIV